MKTNKSKRKLWILISMLLFIVGFALGILLALDSESKFTPTTFFLNFLNSITSGIIVFIILGPFVNFLIFRKNGYREDWLYITTFFYGIAFFYTSSKLPSYLEGFIFPLLFSPILVSSAIEYLSSVFNHKVGELTILGGELFFILTFVCWTYLEFLSGKFHGKLKNVVGNGIIIKRILLVLLFIILLIGIHSCVDGLPVKDL